MPHVTVVEQFQDDKGNVFHPGHTYEVSPRMARIAIRNKWAVAGERIIEKRDGTLTLHFELDEKCFVQLGEQELVEQFGLDFYKQLYVLSKAAAERITANAVISQKDAQQIADLFGIPVEAITTTPEREAMEEEQDAPPSAD